VKPAPATTTASDPALESGPPAKPSLIERILGNGLWIVATLGFAAAFYSAMDWRFAARLMPQTAAAVGLLVIGCMLAMIVVARIRGRAVTISRAHYEIAGMFEDLTERVIYRRFGGELLWLLGLLLGVWAIGMLPAMGLYMFLYMVTVGRTRIGPAAIITVALWIGMYLLFVKLLHVPWPPSLLGDMLPEWRDATGRLI
jgi:hypothetical protein